MRYKYFAILEVVYDEITGEQCEGIVRARGKDRHYYMALEAITTGHGGAIYISRLLSVGRSTIIKGKKELLASSDAGPIPEGRQRRPGGGRKKKTDQPDIKALLTAFIEAHTNCFARRHSSQ